MASPFPGSDLAVPDPDPVIRGVHLARRSWINDINANPTTSRVAKFSWCELKYDFASASVDLITVIVDGGWTEFEGVGGSRIGAWELEYRVLCLYLGLTCVLVVGFGVAVREVGAESVVEGGRLEEVIARESRLPFLPSAASTRGVRGVAVSSLDEETLEHDDEGRGEDEDVGDRDGVEGVLGRG